jgi:hypothetical protein
MKELTKKPLTLSGLYSCKKIGFGVQFFCLQDKYLKLHRTEAVFCASE